MSIEKIPGHDLPGLRIRTAEGWKLLLKPMQPVPEHPKWWRFGVPGAWERLFAESDATQAIADGSDE